MWRHFKGVFMENTGKMFKQTLEDLTEKLLKQIEEGRSEGYLQYLRFASRFYSYSFGNLMLIQHQMPDASRVASFNKWKSLGRQVRKGQKSLKILAPLVLTKKDQQGNESTKCFGFKAVSVFDISQTEGDDLPESPFQLNAADPSDLYGQLKRLIESKGISVVEVDEKMSWFGSMSRVSGIKINKNHSDQDKALSLIHELAHYVLGHGTEDTKGLSLSERECQAESTAFIVAESLGMTASVSKDYLLSYGTDRQMFLKNLEMILQASRKILDLFSSKDTALVDDEITAVA